MKALIVEDSIPQLNALDAMLRGSFSDIECLKTATYDDAVRLMTENDIQLFLLDVDLGITSQKDGIAVGTYARSLEKYYTTPILFLTAKPDEVMRAIHATNCYDYLTKPYDQSMLIKSIKRLIDLEIITEPPVRFADRNGIYMRLQADDIIYIKSEGRNMIVQTTTVAHETSRLRLAEFEAMLPSYIVRCHKSYLVNLHRIQSYDSVTATIQMSTRTKLLIPVGRRFVPDFERDLRLNKISL